MVKALMSSRSAASERFRRISLAQVKFTKGDTVIKEGALVDATDNGLYIVDSGHLKVRTARRRNEWYASHPRHSAIDLAARPCRYGPPFGSDCPTGCPDALSGGLTELDDLHTRYWTYRMEWKLGADGKVAWYYDGAFVWSMDAASFGEYQVCAAKPEGGEQNAKVATFYSINATQSGLTGLNLPGQMIYRAVRQLRADPVLGPQLSTYATLSPIPSFAAWPTPWTDRI